MESFMELPKQLSVFLFDECYLILMKVPLPKFCTPCKLVSSRFDQYIKM